MDHYILSMPETSMNLGILATIENKRKYSNKDRGAATLKAIRLWV
jgi:hypothetical protein